MECVLYDFDETLTRRDTTRMFVKAALGSYPVRVLAAAPRLLEMQRAKGNPARLQDAKFRMFGTLLKGLTPAGVGKINAGYVEQAKRSIRTAVWTGLEKHLSLGRRGVIVTASPRIAVQAVFDAVSMPVTVIGTEFNVAGGRFTGALDGAGCYGAHKVPAIQAWVGEQHDDVTFLEAWSDSQSDAPMMKLAQQRHWICPPCEEARIKVEDPQGLIFRASLEN